MSPQCQSASCWLISNNRLITAFHPSFLLHPAEPGSRPDLSSWQLPTISNLLFLEIQVLLGGASCPSPLLQTHWGTLSTGWQWHGKLRNLLNSPLAPPHLLCSPQERSSSQQSERVIWGWAERKWERLAVAASFGGLAQSCARAGWF